MQYYKIKSYLLVNAIFTSVRQVQHGYDMITYTLVIVYYRIQVYIQTKRTYNIYISTYIYNSTQAYMYIYYYHVHALLSYRFSQPLSVLIFSIEYICKTDRFRHVCRFFVMACCYWYMISVATYIRVQCICLQYMYEFTI